MDGAQPFGVSSELIVGLAAALGSGLLIGLERERHKRRGPNHEPAGLRTFTLASMCGALAQALAVPGLVPVGALAITALAAMAYLRSRGRPGLTTEAALLVTYLIGALCVTAPLLGSPAAVVMTALLAARTRLHRFATQVLREEELHDALLLGALALVVMPLMPQQPLPWLAGMKAHSLLGLMLLMLVLQAVGHVALRLAGPQAGLAVSGLLSGLVSSTATIAAMGARARAQPGLALACAAGAVMSTCATWLLAQVMLFAMAPQAALLVLPVSLLGAALCGGLGWLLARRSRRDAEATPAAPEPEGPRGPLRLREALVLSLMLGAVAVAVSWAREHFGRSGLYGAVALTAFADVHAPIASLAGLQAAGSIGRGQVLLGLLLAFACNSTTRGITAVAAGGWRFARFVIPALALPLLLGGGLAALLLFGAGS
ncbi:MgtC/SapB family protein [Pelomonas sp. P7]|uniref:MgtC/SapB family protein n=1 Tax=Pelomonas caseinilytica TaxID=2906763 RepID=A0ABS8XDF5_9BURK|nr:MgtC/SapB family protein [Pelomonas sp. P7]MCE4536608.1 MgtC/SapB family protein [Pelomonas sp. P7]